MNLKEKFRKDVKEKVDELKEWLNDCLQYRVSFSNDNEFHLHIIEDYCTHLHIRGEIDEDGTNILYIRSQVTQDVFDEILQFVKDWEA